jgi:membrane-associated HD superfamily phosphohydrolase
MADSTNGNPPSQENPSFIYSSQVCIPDIWKKLGDCKEEVAKFSGKIDNARLEQEIKDLKTINSLQATLSEKETTLSKCLQKNQKAGELELKKDSIKDLKGTIKTLNDSIGRLNGEIDSKNTIINNKDEIIEMQSDTIGTLTSQAKNWKNQIFEGPNFALIIALIITLIISITMISLKRGLTFTKGNTSICLGEKKRTRTKKAD